MGLSKRDVEHVAALARLHVAEEDKDSMAQALSRILEFAQGLQALDLSGVEATSQVGVSQSVTRTDTVRPSLSNDAALANAPDAMDGQFRVPSVLEG